MGKMSRIPAGAGHLSGGSEMMVTEFHKQHKGHKHGKPGNIVLSEKKKSERKEFRCSLVSKCGVPVKNQIWV